MLTAQQQAQRDLDAANATSAVALSMLLAAARARTNFVNGSAVITTLTSETAVDAAIAATAAVTIASIFRRDLTTALDAHAAVIANPLTLAEDIVTEEASANDLINLVSAATLLIANDAVTVLEFAGRFSAALAESAIKNDLRDYFDLKKTHEFAREAAEAAAAAVSAAEGVLSNLP
jgi:hypothetical protein